VLFFAGPAIDFVKVEAPFPTYTKAGELFPTQQAIHGGWIYTQIFGEFCDLQNLWDRNGIFFVGSLFVAYRVHLWQALRGDTKLRFTPKKGQPSISGSLEPEGWNTRCFDRSSGASQYRDVQPPFGTGTS
jgi:hypothetical protein